jgi:hypothetical protein
MNLLRPHKFTHDEPNRGWKQTYKAREIKKEVEWNKHIVNQIQTIIITIDEDMKN